MARRKTVFDLLVEEAEDEIKGRFPRRSNAAITKLAERTVNAYLNDNIRAECWMKAIGDAAPYKD